jgi:hypothetical protein
VKNNIFIVLFFTLFISSNLYAQKNKIKKNETKDRTISKKIVFDPLSPAKASFYSAILPGLGQAYNKQYWKIPIVYGGLTAGISIYSYQNKQYNRYRDAYKSRVLGFTDDEFFEDEITDETIIKAQSYHKKNRDLALLSTILFYILNIVDANVSAHLAQFSVNEDLTLNPNIYQDDISFQPKIGLTLNYQF